MPLKEMTLAVLFLPGAGDAPQRDPVDPRLSPTPRIRRLAMRAEKLSQWTGVQRSRGHQHGAAGRAGAHAPQNGNFGAGAVADAPGPGTAGQRGNVLDADDQSGQHGAVAHAQVDVRRQDGQGQADGKIADEGEVDEAENMPRSGPGSRERMLVEAGCGRRMHDLGRRPM